MKEYELKNEQLEEVSGGEAVKTAHTVVKK